MSLSLTDWIGIYGAALSTAIAVVAAARFGWRHLEKRRERAKFQTDLYFLRKIDRQSKTEHPIVVVLLANLGEERISLKSLEYDGVTENGVETRGSMGWYEQPEEAYGIRNRLLPVVLESGQTADLPMIQIGVVTRTKALRIWFTDFNDRRYYLEQRDIDKVKRDIEKSIAQKKVGEPRVRERVRPTATRRSTRSLHLSRYSSI